MNKVFFWVDYSFEAGCDYLPGRYEMYLFLTDDEKAELEDVALANEEQVNNWDSDWTGHEELYDRINLTAPDILHSLLEQYNPAMAEIPCEVFWELKASESAAYHE